jgi:hypothetical protein
MFGHHHHHHHHGHGGHPAPPPPLAHEQTLYRIFCRADEEYCLTVRDNAVVLAPANPRDQSQACYCFALMLSLSLSLSHIDRSILWWSWTWIRCA